MLLIFIIEFLTFGFLCFYANDKYADFNEAGHKSDHISVIIMPAALFITDKLLEGRFNDYKRKLGTKLSELYGGRETKSRIRLHVARKVMYLIIASLAVTFFGALMEKSDTGYVIFASTVLLVVFYAGDRELDKNIKKRNFYIQYDFPDFLNKLVLLINAGMTVPRAWEKIVRDRENMTPLYEELNITYLEIKNGKAETEALEDFARRCRVREITKFITAVIQNLRKGSSELVPLLKLQSNECWHLRKNMAKRLGEEASTKLLIPLMLMFLGILIIVILPAVLQLKYL